MLQLVIGFLAGGLAVIVAVRIQNQKLNNQKRHYEKMLCDSNGKVSQLTTDDAFRRGREYEYEQQRRYRVQLLDEIDVLKNDNNDLRHQLGLECLFEHKLRTGGRATMTVIQERTGCNV